MMRSIWCFVLALVFYLHLEISRIESDVGFMRTSPTESRHMPIRNIRKASLTATVLRVLWQISKYIVPSIFRAYTIGDAQLDWAGSSTSIRHFVDFIFSNSPAFHPTKVWNGVDGTSFWHHRFNVMSGNFNADHMPVSHFLKFCQGVQNVSMVFKVLFARACVDNLSPVCVQFYITDGLEYLVPAHLFILRLFSLKCTAVTVSVTEMSSSFLSSKIINATWFG